MINAGLIFKMFERLNGRLEAEPEPGKGSPFHVCLPRQAGPEEISGPGMLTISCLPVL